MIKILFFCLSLLLLAGCDSFPKKMQSERVGSPVSDQIQITAECSALTSPYPISDDKHAVITKLYIVNSSTFPIHFSPQSLLSTEQDQIEFSYARGAKEASQKKILPKDKTLIVNAGDDYLIDLSFNLKNEAQFQKVIFDVSGVFLNERKRPSESFACLRRKTLDH